MRNVLINSWAVIGIVGAVVTVRFPGAVHLYPFLPPIAVLLRKMRLTGTEHEPPGSALSFSGFRGSCRPD